MRFEAAYDRHVAPLVVEMTRVNGTLIACGLMTWSEALDAILSLARSRGAGLLSNTDMLEDRLAVALLTEIDLAAALRRRSESALAQKPSAFWRYVWKDMPSVSRR